MDSTGTDKEEYINGDFITIDEFRQLGFLETKVESERCFQSFRFGSC